MFFTAGLFISCEESDSPTVVPHVSFENDRIFGLSPGAANDTQDIKVYATMSSGSDRVYSLQVDETSTLAAGQYTVPATVTIPANTKMGTFPVTISSTTLDSEKTLIIKMVDITDGTFTGAAGLTLTAKVVL